MRRAPCPRCARPGGVPIEYGLPDEELFEQAARGEVHIGGCLVFDGNPDFRCTFCGREWADGPLPAWWPPVDAATVGVLTRDAVRDELTARLDAVRRVVEVVERLGAEAAAGAPAEFRLLYGPELIGNPADGIGTVVVPSDCVLVAEALDAALAVCRALEPDDGAAPDGPAPDGAVLHGLLEAFRRADVEWARRGDVDVLRMTAEPEEDDEDEDDPWLTDEDRLEALVGDGDGSVLPAVGPEWHEDLDVVAADVLADGSATAWARFVWSHLGFEPIVTQTDLARARIRLVALGLLRRGFLDRLDGDAPDEFPWSDAENPGVGPYYLGRLAAAEGVGPDPDLDEWLDEPAETDALRELVRVECDRLGSALAHGVGVSRLFAHTWASRFAGARYPLSADATDEALNANLTPDKHIAFEWLGEGMPL